MMSRAGMTGRLDRLEEAGLVARTLVADDRRSFRVSLTPRGRRVVDAAVDDHAAILDPLQSPLARAERPSLDLPVHRLRLQFPHRRGQVVNPSMGPTTKEVATVTPAKR
jgi:DNA-binding MarR family transcriptional regulator